MYQMDMDERQKILSSIDENVQIFSKYLNLLTMQRQCLDIINTNQQYFNGKCYPSYIVMDTETTGLPTEQIVNKKKMRCYDSARILQFCWCVYDIFGNVISINDHIIRPVGYKVEGTQIHGITQQQASHGDSFKKVVLKFLADCSVVKCIIGHNIAFDVSVIKHELYANQMFGALKKFGTIKTICTKNASRKYENRFLKQSELYEYLIGIQMEHAHNAKNDVLNLGEIVVKMIMNGDIFV